MACVSCGTANDDGARFCGSCGAATGGGAVATAPTSVAVPQQPRPAQALTLSSAVLKVGERVTVGRALQASAGSPHVPSGASAVVLGSETGVDGIARYDLELVVDGVPVTRQVTLDDLRHGAAPGASLPETGSHREAESTEAAPAPDADLLPSAAIPSVAGAAPAPTATDEFKGLRWLVPFFLYKLVFSLRRPLVVKTTIGSERLHVLFSERLSGQSSLSKLVAMSSSYTRNVRWSVRRTGDHTSQAVCTPKDLVAWSAGRMKRYLDVSGDKIELETSPQRDGSVIAVLGVTEYTTVWGFFAFPAMHVYARQAVKAWRKEDPQLQIKYPLSASRLVAWGVLAVLLLSAAL